LQRDSSTLEFAYHRFGKPAITDRLANRTIHFNVTHSDGLALYAVTSLCPVGVDVERLRPVPELLEIASRFFAPAEANRLLSLAHHDRTEGFFAYWTCKEAFLKATGDGIGETLKAIEVAPTGDRHVPCRVTGAHAACNWHLERLWPAAGYVGAVAYPDHTACLSFRNVANSAFLAGSEVVPCLI
jgi:4'-phosphopantetheinyl transferase